MICGDEMYMICINDMCFDMQYVIVQNCDTRRYTQYDSRATIQPGH